MRYIALFLLTTSISMYGMENSSISPKKSRIYCTNEVDDCGFVQVKASLSKTQQGDEILLSIFDLTDSDLLRILGEAKKRGVNVQLIVCGTKFNADLKKKLERYSLQYRVFNANKNLIDGHTNYPQKFHKKTIAWNYIDPITQQKQYRTWKGSRNFTQMAKKKSGKEANHELMIYVNDPEHFEQEKKLFSEHWAMVEHAPMIRTKINSSTVILPKTPTKVTTLNSNEYNLNRSIAARFENANNKLYINWYNIDDPTIFESIKKAAQKTKQMEILTNETALDKESTRTFLTSLTIPVFVYNATQTRRCGPYPVANHVKNFIREQENGDCIIGISEANLSQERNIASLDLVPNDVDNAQRCLIAFNMIKKESLPLQEALAAKGYGTASKKRKQDIVAEQPPAKRQLFSTLTSAQYIYQMKDIVKSIQAAHKNEKLTLGELQQKKSEIKTMLRDARLGLSEKESESVLKQSRSSLATMHFFEFELSKKK